jgi:hypothetical protein
VPPSLEAWASTDGGGGGGALQRLDVGSQPSHGSSLKSPNSLNLAES